MSCITATKLAECMPQKLTVNSKAIRKFQGHVSACPCLPAIPETTKAKPETKHISLVENYNLQNYLSYGIFYWNKSFKERNN